MAGFHAIRRATDEDVFLILMLEKLLGKRLEIGRAHV